MSNGLVCCWHRWVLISPLPKRDSPDRDRLLAVLSFSPIFVAMVDLAIFSRTDVKVMGGDSGFSILVKIQSLHREAQWQTQIQNSIR